MFCLHDKIQAQCSNFYSVIHKESKLKSKIIVFWRIYLISSNMYMYMLKVKGSFQFKFRTLDPTDRCFRVHSSMLRVNCSQRFT